MGLFTQNKDLAVKAVILNLVNNNCPSLKATIDGPRLEQRVNLSIPAVIVPIHDGTPEPTEAITAVTKDFSTTGCSIVVDHPHVPQDSVIIFKSQGKAFYILANTRHLNPMGGGFFQCGFKLTEVLEITKYPELEKFSETL